MDGINALAEREYAAKASLKPGVKLYLAQLRAQGVAMAAATATIALWQSRCFGVWAAALFPRIAHLYGRGRG